MRKRVPVKTVHWATVAVFAVMAVLQLVPLLMGHAGRGYTSAALPVVGLAVALWVAAAVGLLLRKSWGYIAAVFGSITAIAHGGVLRLGSDPLGVAFLLLGFAAFALVISDRRAMGFGAANTRPSLA